MGTKRKTDKNPTGGLKVPNDSPSEIDITPEMAEARAEVLCGADIWPPDRRLDWAIEVYRAMAALDVLRRNPSPERSPTD